MFKNSLVVCAYRG